MIITAPEPSTRLAWELADHLLGLSGGGWQRALDQGITWGTARQPGSPAPPTPAP